jgi:hypothetical protein
MVRFIGTLAHTCLAAITRHSAACSRLVAETIKSNASAVSPRRNAICETFKKF